MKVEDGRLVVYPGDYSSYLANMSNMFSGQDSIQQKPSNPSKLPKGKHNQGRNTRRYSVNKMRKLNQRIRTIESELENINSEMNNLERFFTDPKEIENPEQLAKLGLKHEALKKQSEELEREWEQLSSDVETNIT